MYKVGDLVKFCYQRKIPIKTGEIVAIYENGTYDIYVISEGKVYHISEDRIKKI